MPHLLDLYCGRGGWTKAALSAGWTATGIDCVDLGYPARLIVSSLPWPTTDLLALRPDLIVASPPCEQYARHHLPWIKGPPPDTSHMDWCLELARTLQVPIVIECSKFAAKHHPASSRCGSFHLWGTVPTLLPLTARTKTRTTGEAPARRAEIPALLADWVISLHSKG